jgi:tetratricopeptide (TPR) repeat protein
MNTAPLRHRWPLLLPALLAGIVFFQVDGFGFVNLDDDLYVTGNPLLAVGASPLDAVTTPQAEVWVPATWLSLMADHALAGMDPGAFHRTNLLLHLLNVLLVGVVAERLLRRRWAAAALAALFAVHPLNVEAVCWVTARKDLLSGSFALAAVGLHLHGNGGRATLRHAAVGVLALLAMLAKPALVVLPAWLVLVDAWRAADEGLPLRTCVTRGGRAKLAALAGAAAVAAVTIRLARGAEYGMGEPVGLLERLGQAAFMIVTWLGRLLWPRGLAPLYPPNQWEQPGGVLVMAVLAVVVLTVGAVLLVRQRPLLACGWLWFLVGVAPAVGIVRGGQLLLSDRYVYLPMLGVLTGLVCLAMKLLEKRPAWSRPAAGLAVALTLVLAGLSYRQAGIWQGPLTLWPHTLAVTADNAIAHTNHAVALDEAGRADEALHHLEESLRIAPHSLAHYNAGNILAAQGRLDEAVVHFREARRRDPDRLEYALNLGALLARTGRTAEALTVLQDAARRHPQAAAALYNLGLVHWLRGEVGAARAAWQEALARDPGHADARRMLERSRSTSLPASPDSSGP